MRWAGRSEPRSAAGVWLITTLKRDWDKAAEQREALSGAPLADLAVLRLVFESLTLRAFNGAPASDVHAFATRLLDLPESPALDQLQVTAAIRAAIGTREVRYHGFEADQIALIWVIVAHQLVQELRVSPAELRKVVRLAEEVAEQRFDITLTPAS